MYKFIMKIDGTPYKALFKDPEEAHEFIYSNEVEDDAVVKVQDIQVVTPEQVYHDGDFSDAYACEMILSHISPSAYKACKNTSEVISVVKELAEFLNW